MTEGLLFAADLAEDEYIAVYGYVINRVSRFTSGVDGEIYLFNAHSSKKKTMGFFEKFLNETVPSFIFERVANIFGEYIF